MEEQKNISKYLLIGLIAAIVTVIGGELPIGWYVKPNIDDMLQAQLEGYASVTMLQLASGVLFGGIGIAFQAFGYEAISRIIMAETNCIKAAKVVHLGALFCGMFGPLVHILAIMMMYICRFADVNIIMQFAAYFVAPITVVFMPVYMLMMVVIFIMVIKGKTILPKWSAFMNPAIIMVVVNLVTFFIGNYHFSNSLQMANMGLGSLITFIYWKIKY